MNKLGMIEILYSSSVNYFSAVFRYSLLFLYNTGFCSGGRIRKLLKISKNGQTVFFIEVKMGNFFLGNRTNPLLYAVSARILKEQRKYI